MELLDQMELTCLIYETTDDVPDKMFYLHPQNQHENSVTVPALALALGVVRIHHLLILESKYLLLSKD